MPEANAAGKPPAGDVTSSDSPTASAAATTAKGSGSKAPAEDSGNDSSPLGDLGDYIRDQRERARLTLRGLSKLAGVSNPYLSQIERGLRKPSAEILQAIAKALQISSETLYVKAGILEERGEEADVERAILRDPHLSEGQRQSMLEMYRSYRALSQLQLARDGGGRGSQRDVLAAASEYVAEAAAALDPDDDLVGSADPTARPGDRHRIREFIESVRPERDPRDD